MDPINLTRAKEHQRELVALAKAEEQVLISHVAQPRTPIVLAVLQAATDAQPRQTDCAADIVRAMRDAARY